MGDVGKREPSGRPARDNGGALAQAPSGTAAVAEVSIVARYQETDQMGVVHHSVYPVWFEVARSELVKACGMTYGALEAMGVMMPLLSLSCEFLGFCKYEDRVLVRAWVAALSGARMSFAYEAMIDRQEASLCPGMSCEAQSGQPPMQLTPGRQVPCRQSSGRQAPMQFAPGRQAPIQLAPGRQASMQLASEGQPAEPPATRGKAVARGVTEHVFTDSKLKPVNLKKHMPEAFAAFYALMGIGAGGRP